MKTPHQTKKKIPPCPLTIILETTKNIQEQSLKQAKTTNKPHLDLLQKRNNKLKTKSSQDDPLSTFGKPQGFERKSPEKATGKASITQNRQAPTKHPLPLGKPQGPSNGHLATVLGSWKGLKPGNKGCWATSRYWGGQQEPLTKLGFQKSGPRVPTLFLRFRNLHTVYYGVWGVPFLFRMRLPYGFDRRFGILASAGGSSIF